VAAFYAAGCCSAGPASVPPPWTATPLPRFHRPDGIGRHRRAGRVGHRRRSATAALRRYPGRWWFYGSVVGEVAVVTAGCIP